MKELLDYVNVAYTVYQISLFKFLHCIPYRDYGVSDDGFSNPVTSIIVNATLSIFCFINTRELTSHYIFKAEVMINCCIM